LEVFRYEWSLGGFAAPVAGLFLPRRGEGELTFRRAENGRVVSELLITSNDSESGEFWRYGSEIDPAQVTSLRAWSSYRWRDKAKSKEADIETPGVRDVVTSILALRRDPPAETRPLEIWSDGKIYPAQVVPRKPETRQVAGETVAVRHFTIRPRPEPGRDRWKGSMDLWITTGQEAMPVEIRIVRSLANLKLELVQAR
jgi:hypothetical protein